MEYKKGNSNSWKDISGNKYNMLTVIGYVGDGKWNCSCECGNEKIIRTAKITGGWTKSCGCIKKNNAKKHGYSRKTEYNIWQNMKARCYNRDSASYKLYGARGITVCDRWLESFENFIEDMGNKPDGMSLERIDNNSGYSKDNCMWATHTEQALNRRTNTTVSFMGEELPLKAMCIKHGLGYKKVYARINKLGWSVEDALSKK